MNGGYETVSATENVSFYTANLLDIHRLELLVIIGSKVFDRMSVTVICPTLYLAILHYTGRH